MLDAAADLILGEGITVSLDHLRFDEVVAAAGVARTSAYRRWPTKDLFIDDLLVELATASRLGSGWGETDELLITTLDGFLPRPAAVDPEQDRLDVLVEVLRVSAQADVEDVHASPEWRTHIALQATLLGLPAGDLRNAVGDNLRRTEERFGAIRADAFRRLGQLWGFRAVDAELVTDDRDGFDQLALALTATMTGLVVRAGSDPDIVHRTWQLAPFGTTRRAAWSRPALALARTIMAHLVPQDVDRWGDDDIRAAIDGIEQMRTLWAEAGLDADVVDITARQ